MRFILLLQNKQKYVRDFPQRENANNSKAHLIQNMCENAPRRVRSALVILPSYRAARFELPQAGRRKPRSRKGTTFAFSLRAVFDSF